MDAFNLQSLQSLLETTKNCSQDVKVRRRRVALVIKELIPFASDIKTIKVAGTNGKGSVCAMLQATLNRDGKSAGVFTSPHLYQINERIRIDNTHISTRRFDGLASALSPRLNKFIQKHGALYKPSFFEVLLVIAFEHFHHHNVDFVLIESGIGGYRDAVGVFPSTVSAITSVGLDHVLELGNTLESIAIDKSGIAPDDTPLVLGAEIPVHLVDVIKQQCRPRGVGVTQASNTGIEVIQETMAGTRLTADGVEICLGLLGEYQVANFATVRAVYGKLLQLDLVDNPDSLQGVESAVWPGRLEYMQAARNLIFDVAHNAHGFEALGKSIDKLAPFEQRVIVYGASQGKDYQSCLPLVRKLAPQVIFVEGFHKAVSTQELSGICPPDEIFESVELAVAKLERETLEGKLILVVGSAFLVGHARHLITK